MRNIVVVGGGLAGLTTACLLQKQGFQVTLFEKKSYPFHRVCGEYVSNEVVPFLKSQDLFPTEIEVTNIKRFQLSAANGKSITVPLALGGFGISRFIFDQLLYEKAMSLGVDCRLNTSVEKISFQDNIFTIETNGGGSMNSSIVISAHGKRSNLDKALSRNFINRRSPYVGVKYHIETNFPDDLIALHNFPQGYCGISNIEEGKTNLCYLSRREPLKKFGSIEELEKEHLFQNPFLKEIFENAHFLFERPEVINEISFAKKAPVENHMFMVGDSAGLITPLCGNGMAMAFHSAKLASETIVNAYNTKRFDRIKMEKEYSKKWTINFQKRLWFGRQLQAFFGNIKSSSLLISLAKMSPGITRHLIDQTHGKPF